jgi:hypothetical protein
MKIYLSHKKSTNSEFTHVSNIMMLDNIVTNCEATEIVVDNFLLQFSLGELPIALDKILSKLRINSKLTIKEKDIDIISMKYGRGDWSLEELNSNTFDSTAIKCFLNIETIQGKLSNKVQIEKSHLDQKNGNFLIVARRLK